ncbi:hypothetical protein Pelo_15414 [Pelomyxa schiedti]|nr:hypothetical protein Pelo_15414 [Pelomyxa schiedti]
MMRGVAGRRARVRRRRVGGCLGAVRAPQGPLHPAAAPAQGGLHAPERGHRAGVPAAPASSPYDPHHADANDADAAPAASYDDDDASSSSSTDDADAPPSDAFDANANADALDVALYATCPSGFTFTW